MYIFYWPTFVFSSLIGWPWPLTPDNLKSANQNLWDFFWWWTGPHSTWNKRDQNCCNLFGVRPILATSALDYSSSSRYLRKHDSKFALQTTYTMKCNSKIFVTNSRKLQYLFNKADKLSIFCEYLEEFHDERKVIVSSANIFYLKMMQ